MLLTKLKIISTGLVVVAVGAMSAGVLSRQASTAEPTARLNQDRPAPMKQNLRRAPDVVKVASPLAGVVLFIGTETQAGEKVPPERLITIKVGGAEKQFRRLKKGDTVKEGQLLARLDDGMARTQLNAKEARLQSSKADADGAKSIADEAESKLTTANDLYAKRAIALEEWRSAKLTRDKMWYDRVAKKEAVKQAEIVVKQAQTFVASHDIRSGVNGVIVAIRKRPGEAANKFETILEIEIADTDAAKRAREQLTQRLRVPSLMEGIVQFVGSEIKAGEKVPPERLLTVKVGSDARKFRRLQKGDSVVAGQLLVQLDDQPARSEVEIKEANLAANKANADGAKSIADEAESKLTTANDNYARRAIALEEWRSAKLTRDKMWYDSISKIEAMKVAELELHVSRLNLKQYEVRAPASGTIATIRKRPGEAVRELETVIELDVPEKE